MTAVEVLQLGNPTLRERSKPVLDPASEKRVREKIHEANLDLYLGLSYFIQRNRSASQRFSMYGKVLI